MQIEGKRRDEWHYNTSIKSWHVFQGFETQVEKSTKELIPIFLEIGSGLSKYNQTDADVLTMQTRYTWIFCSKFPERKFLTWTNENFWEIDGRQAWSLFPDLSLLAYGRYLERKGKENLPRTLAIVKNCQKFLLKTAILFVKREMEKIIRWKVMWNFPRKRKISIYYKLLKFKVKCNFIGKILL